MAHRSKKRARPDDAEAETQQSPSKKCSKRGKKRARRGKTKKASQALQGRKFANHILKCSTAFLAHANGVGSLVVPNCRLYANVGGVRVQVGDAIVDTGSAVTILKSLPDRKDLMQMLQAEDGIMPRVALTCFKSASGEDFMAVLFSGGIFSPKMEAAITTTADVYFMTTHESLGVFLDVCKQQNIDLGPQASKIRKLAHCSVTCSVLGMDLLHRLKFVMQQGPVMCGFLNHRSLAELRLKEVLSFLGRQKSTLQPKHNCYSLSSPKGLAWMTFMTPRVHF
eukprot:6490306-Amphidinium_carterae.2